MATLWIALVSITMEMPAPRPVDDQAVQDTSPVWAVTAPASIALARDSALSLAITTNKDLTSLAVVSTTLQEQTTKALVGLQRLTLTDSTECRKKGAQSSSRLPQYSPKAPTRMILCVDSLNPGTYSGTISIGAANAGDPKAVSLTIYATTLRVQLFGVLSIALGVLTSLAVTVFLKQRSARAEAMLPAADLVEDARAHKVGAIGNLERLALKEDSIPNFAARVKRLESELTLANLDRKRFLPAVIRSPFVAPGTSSQYAQFLEEKGIEVAILGVLADGIRRIAVMKPATGDPPAAPPEAVQAVKETDDAVAVAADVTSARTLVNGILAKLVTVPEGVVGEGGRAALPPEPLPSPRELLLRQQSTDASVWLIWAVLTVAVGVSVLLLSNPGFGTGSDLMKCFFWGLGVQIAGQQLQQLAPNTVSSTLSLSVPRA